MFNLTIVSFSSGALNTFSHRDLLTAQLFLTLIINNNIASLAPKQHIIMMIFDGSCDTED